MRLIEHHNYRQELLKLKANNGHNLQTTNRAKNNNNNKKTLALHHLQPPKKLLFFAFGGWGNYTIPL